MATITMDVNKKRKVLADVWPDRPRLTAAQIAEAIEQGKADAAGLNASVGGGRGNYTEDRHKFPERTHEEVWADIQRIQAEMMTA